MITCTECQFRVGEYCHKHPPHGTSSGASWPLVSPDYPGCGDGVATGVTDATLAAINATLEGINTDTESVDTKLTTTNTTLSTIDTVADTISATLITIDTAVDTANATLTTIDTAIDTANSTLTTIDTAVDTANTNLTGIDAVLTYDLLAGPNEVTVTTSSLTLAELGLTPNASLRRITIMPKSSGIYWANGAATAGVNPIPMPGLEIDCTATSIGTREFIVASGTITMEVTQEG